MMMVVVKGVAVRLQLSQWNKIVKFYRLELECVSRTIVSVDDLTLKQ